VEVEQQQATRFQSRFLPWALDEHPVILTSGVVLPLVVLLLLALYLLGTITSHVPPSH
jgi:hypothetical protein